jgi:hypothetical protein
MIGLILFHEESILGLWPCCVTTHSRMIASSVTDQFSITKIMLQGALEGCGQAKFISDIWNVPCQVTTQSNPCGMRHELTVPITLEKCSHELFRKSIEAYDNQSQAYSMPRFAKPYDVGAYRVAARFHHRGLKGPRF